MTGETDADFIEWMLRRAGVSCAWKKTDSGHALCCEASVAGEKDVACTTFFFDGAGVFTGLGHSGATRPALEVVLAGITDRASRMQVGNPRAAIEARAMTEIVTEIRTEVMARPR